MKTTDNGYESPEEKLEKPKESKYKNLTNAKANYEYFKSKEKHIINGYKVKVHDDLNESEFYIYVMFSWKGINNEAYSFPLSFHLPSIEFQEKMKRFLRKGESREYTEWLKFD